MIFLSHILDTGTPLYGGTGRVDLVLSRQIAKGDAANNSDLGFPAHSGTHVDAPFHFDPDGKRIGDFPAAFWICDHVYLLEVAAAPGQILSLAELLPALAKMPSQTELLLIKTGFERFRERPLPGEESPYIFQGPGISSEIGLWLRRNRHLKMIGFDFISVTNYSNRELGREAHRAFLGPIAPGNDDLPLSGPILIIEDMTLSGLSRAPRRVVVAPLRYDNADGAPATVIAEDVA